MVPVILLTGFLGSGKTSLLNRLMRARPESQGKLAIVVNEFGDVGIDGDLLPADMTRQVELPGGCICCVLNEDLDKTLLELLDGFPEVEQILIETTGVAEPLPISWSLGAEPLSRRLRLSAVVTVVDVLEFPRSRPLSPAVDNQVAYADLLVLSKTDLLPGFSQGGQPPGELMDAVRGLNQEAPLLRGPAEQVVELLWASLADPSLEGARAGARASSAQPPSHHADDGHAHDHTSGEVGSIHDFDTVWYPIEHTLDFEELETLLEELPANYVRIKGIARVIDGSTGSYEPHLVAFHRVGARVSREPIAGAVATRVVALGPGIERARLAACVDAAVVPSD